jgi:chromosome segregation ATPase
MSDHLLQREDPAGIGAVDPLPDDPFALLQGEIAYLENEVRLRDEAILELQAGAAGEIDHGADDKIKELTAELAYRDETIRLLFDQLQQIEEAESQHLEEWGQLRSYIDELERRSDADPRADDEWRLRLEEELEAERQRSESQRLANDVERRAWEAQRRSWEQEAQLLKARISESESRQDPAHREAAEKLREENQRLRDRLLEQSSAAEAARAGEEHRPPTAEINARLLQLELEKEEERRRAEAQAQAADADRKSREAREAALEEEVQRLRGQLAEITLKTNAQVNFALVALEEENQALRRRYQEATRDSEAAQELPALRRELEAIREQLEQSQDEVGRLLSDRGADDRTTNFELDLERGKLDLLRREFEEERAGWQERQRALDAEAERLRGRLAEYAAQGDRKSAEAVAALEEEARGLRAKVEELAGRAVAAARDPEQGDAAALRGRLDEAAAELRAAAEAREQDQQAWQRQWESQRRTHESERKAWASKQTSWENELAYLRSQLSDATRQQETRVQTAVAALAEENRQLRHQAVARPDPAPIRAIAAPVARTPRPESRPMVDLRAMRAKLDQSQEEIQKRLWKLNQLRNLSQRKSGEPAGT